MPLEKEPFRRYAEDDNNTIDAFSVRLNPEERKILETCKAILEQSKDSTALKQLAWYGAKVIHEEKTAYLLGVVFKNKRNNKRLNIIDFD